MLSLSRRFLTRYVLASTSLLALWVLGMFFLAPRVMRAAYSGTSVDVLNRAISGRDQHAVQHYLDLVSRLAWLGTGAIVAMLVICLALWVARHRLHDAWRSAVRSEPLAGLAEQVAVAAWLGLALGAIEATVAWFRYRGGYMSEANNPHVLWMAPLAEAVLFAVIALVVYPLTGGRRHGLSIRMVGFLCALIGLYGVFADLRTGIHPLAIVLVVVGGATQLARTLDRTAARKLVGRTVLPFASLAAVIGVTSIMLNRLHEQRDLVGLPEQTGPNILLLVLDTVRGESMSLYGYDRPTTPNLENRATAGVVFERAFSTTSWTLPAHASLFTGLLPGEHGADWQTPLDARLPTLASYLSEKGYATGGFVANVVYAARNSGLGRGFHRYRDHPVSLETWSVSAWAPRTVLEWIWDRLPMRRHFVGRKYADEVNDEFLSWLDELEGRPFFGFVNYFDAHMPFEIHEELLHGVAGGAAPRRLKTGPEAYEPLNRSQARAVDGYDTSLAFIDAEIERLFSELQRRGVLENTIVIVTSDHGEHLGERGQISHGQSLYSQVTLVPLVVWAPRDLPVGRRVRQPVSLRDVPATVTRLAGLSDAPFPGRSLARFWDGDSPPVDEPVTSSLSRSPFEGSTGPVLRGDMRAVVLGSHHYVLNGDGEEELFDLRTDPSETVNLAENIPAPEVLGRFREIVKRDVPKY